MLADVLTTALGVALVNRMGRPFIRQALGNEEDAEEDKSPEEKPTELCPHQGQ